MSAFAMLSSILFEKKRFLPLHFFTIAPKPGSNTGNFDRSLLFQESIFSTFISTTSILNLGQFAAITDMVGPPTYPAPMQQIFLIDLFCISNKDL